ncbi:interferon-induced GTP-binding protein Mx2 [Cucurbitaria berberidis CBS 394.84]|uniref:Interferon-induced GTP-binding protein Mx2 n=1 Tax=Cucurbitaria berberidis CBS 394.84 TaxID=1168544 RepID=A0A9P4GBM5_9PLEO|nr:interferon-induced GTP-binding protein Mx2 [Cucurbitaria berberidis CBS 394.84]KAF1842442.1 interferon-induced GTP-binding protein Mx2 [Cucurbitaria berberidis CBS 394.84]
MDEHAPTGLANQSLLNKIDKLRELNVKSLELPQLVVVGDQSSGKSSVLESLTGFSFPQDPGLCTRYATQISCRREPRQNGFVSIIPRAGADAATVDRLRSFKRPIPYPTNEILTRIMTEANQAMGIRMSKNDTDLSLQAFSEHILKIEINGPHQEHFTVIDVPGIFRVPSPPLTTDSDVFLVRNLVESYMQNSRTIILAVLPSTIDISTQEVLKMAENADPDGIRTMGVLTKADLAIEQATQDVVKELVLGKRNQVRLGYCVVRNRSADDEKSTISDRLAQEKAFFMESAWKSLEGSGRCGIESLKSRLSDLLLTISKKEFPNVKSDVAKNLDQCRNELENIGPSRKEQNAQRMYLGRLGSKFQSITQCALNGYYNSEAIFVKDTSLKLITGITRMNESFANDVWKKGHKRHISPSWNSEGEVAYDIADSDECKSPFKEIHDNHPELHDIVEMEDYECSEPKAFSNDPITEHIERVYQENRGPELGTFSGVILAVTFKEQSQKWEPLVLAHVSKSIMLVHDYIYRLLANVCPDKQVRDQLWGFLVDELRAAYTRAMEQARFLLRIERNGTPSTFNHYFNSEVQKKRQDRMSATLEKEAGTYYTVDRHTTTKAVPLTSIGNLVINIENMQQMREDILDVLSSYYKVSRKRFVDVICRQVIGHFLLEGEESPLRVFSPELVMGLEAEQLEMIAGEDAETKHRRAMLEAEIKNLETAMKLLRG